MNQRSDGDREPKRFIAKPPIEGLDRSIQEPDLLNEARLELTAITHDLIISGTSTSGTKDETPVPVPKDPHPHGTAGRRRHLEPWASSRAGRVLGG
jgi:hypothetical protein